jgi:hypothetical protein
MTGGLRSERERKAHAWPARPRVAVTRGGLSDSHPGMLPSATHAAPAAAPLRNLRRVVFAFKLVCVSPWPKVSYRAALHPSHPLSSSSHKVHSSRLHLTSVGGSPLRFVPTNLQNAGSRHLGEQGKEQARGVNESGAAWDSPLLRHAKADLWSPTP